MSVIPYSVRDRKININEVNGVDLVSALDNELLMKNSLDQIEGGHLTSVSTSIFGTDTNYLNIYSSDDTTPITSIQSETDGTDYKLHLYPKSVITNPSQSAMTIINNPSNNEVRVGINLTDPEETLEVDGSIQIDSNSVARLKFQKSGSSAHALGEIDGELDGGNGGDLQFYTKVDGGSATEKLRINNIGAIGIGGANFGSSGQVLISNGSGSAVSWTTDLQFNNSNKRLTINGDAFYIGNNSGSFAGGDGGVVFYSNLNTSSGNALFFDNGLATFSPTSGKDGSYSLGSSSRRWSTIYATSGTINTSDDRLKINEKPITGALKLINNLEYYEYDKVNTPDGTDVTHKERGVIAQHLLNTDLSYTISGGKTETIKDPISTETKYIPYGVKYNDLFVTLCSAVKELSARVTTLEQRIN